MGFLGAAPKPRSVLARFDGAAALPITSAVCFAQIAFCAHAHRRGPGDVGAATLAAELAAAAGKADFIPHTTARCATGWRYWRRWRKEAAKFVNCTFGIFLYIRASSEN